MVLAVIETALLMRHQEAQHFQKVNSVHQSLALQMLRTRQASPSAELRTAAPTALQTHRTADQPHQKEQAVLQIVKRAARQNQPAAAKPAQDFPAHARIPSDSSHS